MGKQWKQCQTLFFWAPKSLQMVIAAMKLKDTYSLEGKLDSILKSRDITLSTKVCLLKAMVFPVVMYGCESWTIKKAECQRNYAFDLWYGEDSWESLGLQGDSTSPSKGNQSWIFTGRTDTEAETPILRPPDVKNWLIWKDPDAGKDWRQEEKVTTEDEVVDVMTNLITWVWASSRSWWWTGKPGVPPSIGSQKVRHNWSTELNWGSHAYQSK